MAGKKGRSGRWIDNSVQVGVGEVVTRIALLNRIKKALKGSGLKVQFGGFMLRISKDGEVIDLVDIRVFGVQLGVLDKNDRVIDEQKRRNI